MFGVAKYNNSSYAFIWQVVINTATLQQFFIAVCFLFGGNTQ
jgi:hypothetical protein